MPIRKSNPPEAGSSSSSSPAWIDLPTDVTANILQRLGAVEILSNAQDVCGTWRTVCKDPATWRVIDLRFPQEPVYYLELIGTNEMCRRAVDLSQGQSISIHVEDLDMHESLFDKTLLYISNRLLNLRRLSLANCSGISGRTLARAVERLAVLEELHLTAVENIHPRRIKTIGNSRPTLKSFTFNLPCRKPPLFPDDSEEDRDFLEEEEEEEEEGEEEGEGEGEGEEEEEEEEEGEEEGEGEGEEEEEEEEEGEGGRGGGKEESEEEYYEDDYVDESYLGSKYALAIAQSMPNLRHLALLANYMRNDGIQALLDGCPRLESLDIRQCYRVDLSGPLGDVCLERIKDIKLPYAAVEGFEWDAHEHLNDFYEMMKRDAMCY